MSHRDSTRHNHSAGSAQDLHRVFQWLLDGTDIGHLPLRADCGFTPRGLLITILLWVWSDESTLTHGFQRGLAKSPAGYCGAGFRGGCPIRPSPHCWSVGPIR